MEFAGVVSVVEIVLLEESPVLGTDYYPDFLKLVCAEKIVFCLPIGPQRDKEKAEH